MSSTKRSVARSPASQAWASASPVPVLSRKICVRALRTPGAIVEALPQTKTAALLPEQVPHLVGAVEHRVLHVAAGGVGGRGRTRSPPGRGRAPRSRAARRRRAGRPRGCGSRRTAATAPTGTPWSRSAARSCRKPRNGASPVPAPTMIIGVCGFSGGRNAMLGRADEGEDGAVLRQRRQVARADAGERAGRRSGPAPRSTPDGDAARVRARPAARRRWSSSGAAAAAACRGTPRTAARRPGTPRAGRAATGWAAYTRSR